MKVLMYVIENIIDGPRKGRKSRRKGLKDRRKSPNSGSGF